MRPKVKLIVAVWGEAYVERFMALALPSALAPGNLPALAAGTDLELLVMTTGDGARYFEGKPAYVHLGRICRLRFLAIDDLIDSTAYGVTLTLAYMRGIASIGEDMVNTHFVFLNSDFVLADGSLRTLLTCILQGRQCILAPSFRAVAEDVEPVLEQRVDPETATLAMKPRDMVRLAIRHLHPTSLARMANQGFVRSNHPNQLYWHVDKDTLLGRFYLIFMLCIRPERVVRTINSYCDYGFVPEFCPSGNVTVLTDSDDFFMLETQRRTQELDHLELGTLDPTAIALSLSEWTTRTHRFAATHDLVFHAEDLPPNLGATKSEAEEYVTVVSRLLQSPKDHAFHYHWVAGVEAWREHLRLQGRAGDPPEIAQQPGAGPSGISPQQRFVRLVRSAVIGARPFVRVWHHDWSDYHLIRRKVREISLGSAQRTLFVGDARSPIAALFPADSPAITRVPGKGIEPATDFASGSGETFDAIVCMLTPQDLLALRSEAVDQALRAVREGGALLLLVHRPGTERVVPDITEDLIGLLARLPFDLLGRGSIAYCGGFVREQMRRQFIRLSKAFFRYGPKSAPLLAPGLAGVFAVNVVNNIYTSWRRDESASVPYCSTLIIRFTKAAKN